MARHRTILACGAAIWGASIAVFAAQFPGASDIAQIWAAARGLLEGQNPYDVVGPGQAYDWPYPLLYPFTAVLVGVPFSLLPVWLANTIFTAAGAGLLAWGLTKEQLHDPRLLVFVSMPFVDAGLQSQWSPLLVGAALVSPFGWLMACKPTIGLPLILWRPTWTSVLSSGAFVLFSLAIWPTWPLTWLDTLSMAPHIRPPVLQPWGWLLLTPLVFWRYPQARFVALVACLPQSPLMYEAVLMFLVVRTWGEAAVLWVTTLVAWRYYTSQVTNPSDVYTVLPALAPSMLWGAYLPAAAIVMRQAWTLRTSSTRKPSVVDC